jgi:hypothetical protein
VRAAERYARAGAPSAPRASIAPQPPVTPASASLARIRQRSPSLESARGGLPAERADDLSRDVARARLRRQKHVRWRLVLRPRMQLRFVSRLLLVLRREWILGVACDARTGRSPRPASRSAATRPWRWHARCILRACPCCAMRSVGGWVERRRLSFEEQQRTAHTAAARVPWRCASRRVLSPWPAASRAGARARAR